MPQYAKKFKKLKKSNNFFQKIWTFLYQVEKPWNIFQIINAVINALIGQKILKKSP